MLNLQLIEGFILGAGLLIALGPKDTFVIKNNLAGSNAVVLVLICALSDAMLIMLGVVGLGAVITANRWVMVLTMTVSILYLIYFGIRALQSAYLGQTSVGELGVIHAPMTRAYVVKGAIFHSLLSPFAWLDTVLVIGSISAIKIGADKFFFASGAVVASFLCVASRMIA